MVQNLSIRTVTVYPNERLFDGIVVLRARLAIYLVAANRTKQRRQQILSINWYNGYLSLKSYDKDETFRLRGYSKVDDSWAQEYKFLQALNKKKELEGELEEIQDSLETSQDMIEKKNQISRELQIVSQELAGYNLVFRCGVFSKAF
ncbi:hypothetical protein CAEBREN_03120 [Caenorhabditis brenneri]|uniref:Uncharacterized protein n=1 Tax=Caenorhabditis brenneri TaxID=135651 RepID=G0MFQ3_CAEBE|nr:hypothetical protein CAEBREN_03120 [Caenorhabditis brenneri]